MRVLIILLGLGLLPLPAYEQSLDLKPAVDPEGYPIQTVQYKLVDTVALDLTFYYPSDRKKGARLPAIIFFFGGGWKGGTIEQFAPHARHYASLDMVAVLADYRVENRHGTTPYDAVRDAKSAIRFLRQHARELGIKKNRIVGAGGSAGGHLAAAAGNIDGLEEAREKKSVSSKPDALVLFNPVFDNGPNGYGFDRVGGESGYRTISPMHNITKGAPPTIVFLGTEDPLIPAATAEEYCRRMEQVGSRCELHLYEGQKHGFFNYGNSEYYQKTVAAADVFLRSLGYIE